ARVDVPPGAELIPAEGLHVYPGMIDAATVVGLTEIGSVSGSVDISESGKINAHVRVESAINPESELIPVTRANGITHVLTAPRGGVISGTSALIRLDGWTWEDLTAAAPAAMHVNYPAYPRAGGGSFFGPQVSEEEQRKRREEDLKELRQAVVSARAFRQARLAGSADLQPDPVLEAMIPVLEGAIPVIVSASEVRQIKEAIAWSRAEGLRMILEASADAWRVTDLLKQHDIPVILGPVLSSSFREDEPYDTAYAAPAMLHKAGVRFCIVNSGGGFGASSTRNLPYQAGMAAAFGLPRDVALKAVTLYPAQILGVGDRLGSIEVGKSASLILTDGDPLEIRTRVVREFIDGREVDLANRHQRLYDKYRGRPTVAER
ncbi:MAG TPA: amidohydrolase family protein, partial [Candidatus Polarisedimenticolia bacterium]|nr:amidohydrolase family protein [Candidatus Polarisedimenticolia bacterium]